MADVAQLLERWIVAPEAVGSNPIIRPKLGIEKVVQKGQLFVLTQYTELLN